MSTLTHAAYCVNDHDSGDCCEAEPIEIPNIGEIHVLKDDERSVIYVDDPARGLVAEFGMYSINEAKAVALAMLEAVRIAESDAMSASVHLHPQEVTEC